MPAVRLESVDTGDGMPTIYVPLEQIVETCYALRDTPELRFALLVDLLPVDYLPREPRFEIVYLMASLGVAGFGDTPRRLRVKVRVPGERRVLVPSVSACGRRPPGPNARPTTCSASISAATRISAGS